MRYIFLLLLPLALTAEEAVVPVVAAGAEGTLSPLQMVIYTAVLAFLTWITKKWSSHQSADTEKIQLDATKSLIEQKEVLNRRVNDTLARVAQSWVDDHLPAVMMDALDGGGFSWKEHLKNLYASVRTEVISVFRNEGIDILAVIGEDRLHGMIKSALDKAITALPEKVGQFLPKAANDFLAKQISAFVIARASVWLSIKTEE